MTPVSAALTNAINSELERQRDAVAADYAARAVEEIKRHNKDCTALRDQFKRYRSHTGFTSPAEKKDYNDKLSRLHQVHQDNLTKLKRAYQAELCYRGLAVPDLEVQ